MEGDRETETPTKYYPWQIPTTPHTRSSWSQSRRRSKDYTNVCSSSSSLYETNLNFDDEQNKLVKSYSSERGSSSDEDETDTDLDIESSLNGISRTNSLRKSQELFNRKEIWDDSTGYKSPTEVKTRSKRNDYFSSPINENTPIFKRLVSRNSLKPQSESFRRVTADLQHESVPFEDEVYHEKLILLNLKDNSALGMVGLNSDEDTETSKKIDIIKKANESWNMKKHLSLFRDSETNSSLNKQMEFGKPLSKEIAEESDNKVQVTTPDQHRKKRTHDQEITETPKVSRTLNTSNEFNSFKRRAVSTSPMSLKYIFKKKNNKLISNTSDDLEKMSI